MRKAIAHVVILLLLSAETATANPVALVQTSCLAALKERSLDKAFGYMMAGDRSSLNGMIAESKVFMLKRGLKVEILKKKATGGKIKIRPVGSEVEIWTIEKALKREEKPKPE